MAKPELEPAVADEPPWSDGINEYDEKHFVTYVRLLDADKERASHEEMARIVLGIDPDTEPDRARRAVETHLRRARWMTESGYGHLLEE